MEKVALAETGWKYLEGGTLQRLGEDIEKVVTVHCSARLSHKDHQQLLFESIPSHLLRTVRKRAYKHRITFLSLG